jgi:hypothetical protein
MEAARTSETSVVNYFTRQYIPEDNSELVLCCLNDSLFSSYGNDFQRTLLAFVGNKATDSTCYGDVLWETDECSLHLLQAARTPFYLLCVMRIACPLCARFLGNWAATDTCSGLRFGRANTCCSDTTCSAACPSVRLCVYPHVFIHSGACFYRNPTVPNHTSLFIIQNYYYYKKYCIQQLHAFVTQMKSQYIRRLLKRIYFIPFLGLPPPPVWLPSLFPFPFYHYFTYFLLQVYIQWDFLKVY